MKLNTILWALSAQSVAASSWFGKTAYDSWHNTEVDRWLNDYGIPHPTPSDRKDLDKLIKKNWEKNVVTPYNEWEPAQIKAYLKAKGDEAYNAAGDNKNSLLKSVKSTWTETADSANSAYADVKDWIFDSWTDSQLKAFADKHGIPVPQPRKRDTLLATIRNNYQSAAETVKEYAAYPGDWLYASWSDSDLKQFLDERGIPAPQPTARDKLIAAVRRNSRQASLNMKSVTAAASSSAAAAQESLSNALFDSWSDSQLKDFCDKNGIKVPQGTKRNEIVALARKHRASLLNDNVSASAASAFGAATSKAGNAYAKATDDASLMADHAFEEATNTWSNSRLKAYLDSRGVPVPQSGKTDELLAAVRLNRHKAATGYSAWTFDTWTTANLKKYLEQQGNKAAKKSSATRDELLKAAQDQYAKASASGGTAYASVTSYLASATDCAKDSAFDTWSDSDLKAYLDSYGIKNYQGSTSNELRRMARQANTYFRYGTTTPTGTLWAKLQENVYWAIDQIKIGAGYAQKEAGKQAEKGADYVKEAATTATNRAGEAAQRAGDKLKEEL